jgi:hypothetical protein
MPPLDSVDPTLATDTIYGHCQAFGKRPVSRAGANFARCSKPATISTSSRKPMRIAGYQYWNDSRHSDGSLIAPGYY